VTEITEHLQEIAERVTRASASAGRSADGVTIVAISKGQPAAAVAVAQRAGVRHFGESYTKEALEKMNALPGVPITWHFVGTLQANKTRQIAERFDWVHTVDRIRIAERLNEQRPRDAAPLNVLIQVNQGGEPQKSGVVDQDVAALARAVRELPHLTLRGLMTIPPQSGTPAEWFAALAALRARLASEGIPLDTLSMGMSADFEAAIAAGATLVRIGTAIFGART
jgi:PLP dependent protein